jgi:hypothetical protein
MGAKNRAAKSVENQQFDPVKNLLRNVREAKPGNKAGHCARVSILVGFHCCA